MKPKSKSHNVIKFNNISTNDIRFNSMGMNAIRFNSIGVSIKKDGESQEDVIVLCPIYAIYNVENVDERTLLLGGNFSLSNVKSMSIDGVDIKPIKKHKFQTIGEHTSTMNIIRGITSTAYMFDDCEYLSNVDLSQLDTSKVTDMSFMFHDCQALTTIPQLDTSKVTDMSFMFHDCQALTTIPQLDTSNVTNMKWMFDSCHSLVSIPQLDTSKVTDMNSMFYGCIALENLGGFKNLKVTLVLSPSTKLTHQSLMNVINNLYDLTANGLSGRTLTIGSTNTAKLTASEIAIATNKGWTVN